MFCLPSRFAFCDSTAYSHVLLGQSDEYVDCVLYFFRMITLLLAVRHGFRFPVGLIYFSSLQNPLTGPETRPASYLTRIVGSFPGSKAVGTGS